MNLGILLRRMKQADQSRRELARAVDWFRIELDENPGSVVTWDRLGETLAITGDFKGASDAFEQALALEPENLAHYQKLAKALELQQRYDEAIDVAKRHIEILAERGEAAAALQLREYVEQMEYRKVKGSK